MYGSAVGTPQFMSPEQAEGKLDLMGPASDVYSLGATLYYLVAGQTPFQDRNILELLKKVKAGAWTPARAVNRRVPAALEAVCAKAMALKPADRHASSRALAADVENWLADEPVSCYREPVAVRFRRWAKRHRTLVTSGGLLIVWAVLGLTVSYLLIRREQARTDRFYHMARGAVDKMLTELGHEDLAEIPQMEPVRLEMLTEAKRFYEKFLSEMKGDPGLDFDTGQAGLRLGNIEEQLGDDKKAEAEVTEAIGRFERLLKSRPKDVATRRALGEAHQQRALIRKRSNRFDESEADFREAVKFRQALAVGSPNDASLLKDLNDSRYHLAALIARLSGRLTEAEKLYGQVVDSQRKIVSKEAVDPAGRRKLARYLNNTGILLKSPAGRRRRRRSSARSSPSTASSWPTRRRSRSTASNWPRRSATSPAAIETQETETARNETKRLYAEDVAISRKLATDFPKVPDYQDKLAAALVNEGWFLCRTGDCAAALPKVVEAEATQAAIVSLFPDRRDYRSQLASIRTKRALVHEALQDPKKAGESMKAALDDLDFLVAKYPKQFRYRFQQGETLGLEGQRLFTGPATRPPP